MAKTQQQIQQEQQALLKYGLEKLSDPQDADSVRRILNDMAGYGWFEAASLLGNDSATLKQTSQTNRCIMEQNFILIRQMDRLNKQLSNLTTLLKPTKVSENFFDAVCSFCGSKMSSLDNYCPQCGKANIGG